MENEKQTNNNLENISDNKEYGLKPMYEGRRGEKTVEKTNVSEILISGVMLMTLVAVVCAVLAIINFLTSERIKANEFNSTQTALESIFPDADEFDDVYDELDDTSLINGVTAIYKVYKNEELIGYCTAVSASGFSSQGIDIIVGSDTLNKVVMIKILDNQETPGIGTDVLDENGQFLKQFKGLSRPIEFSTTITSVSRATATSEGVRSGVDLALKAVDLVRVTLDTTVGDSNE